MNDDELRDWLKAGGIASRARELGAGMVEEGVAYLEVAEAVEEFIIESGGGVAFPTNIAVNDIAAHYTPRTNDKLRFRYGDLVKVDVGAEVGGAVGDTAVTVEVGSNVYSDLIEASRRALASVTEVIRGGITLSTIGSIVERTMNTLGFRPIINLTGHSIERYNLHAGLSVPNYDDRSNTAIREGTVVAIEPFSTTGLGEVTSGKRSNIYRFLRRRKHLKEDQLVLLEMIERKNSRLPFSERTVTREFRKGSKLLNGLVKAQSVYSYPILREISGGMVAQTEHTFLVTEKGCRVLTK